MQVLDLSYGGEAGFNQAIELASDTLSNVKLVQEKKVLQRFFEEIARDTGKYSYSAADTMRALEWGTVKQLILWQDLDTERCVVCDGFNRALRRV